MQKTNKVHAELHVWDRQTLKRPAKRLQKLCKQLEKLRRGPMSDASLAEQKELQLKIELLLEQEIFWIQRARANWLKHGDRNTSYFQLFASSRRKKNSIKSLIDDHGVKHENREEMKALVQDYFVNLFTSEVNEVDDMVLADVKRRVTTDMNRDLLAPYTREDVKNALFSIGDFKAPGPDGLHAIFFKRFLNMLGDDLVKEVFVCCKLIYYSRGVEQHVDCDDPKNKKMQTRYLNLGL